LGDRQTAADTFAALADEARTSGATWYQAQSVLGLQLCTDSRAVEAWKDVERNWPPRGGISLNEVRSTGEQPARPLWLLTV
jgi:hypothetical protein